MEPLTTREELLLRAYNDKGRRVYLTEGNIRKCEDILRVRRVGLPDALRGVRRQIEDFIEDSMVQSSAPSTTVEFCRRFLCNIVDSIERIEMSAFCGYTDVLDRGYTDVPETDFVADCSTTVYGGYDNEQ